jgi:hypothetical protein
MTVLATVGLVLLIALVLGGIACLFCNMANGCPFAWLWWACGGVEDAGKLIVWAVAGLATLWSE